MDSTLFERKQYVYDIPHHLIAQEPASPRDHSRLLVVDRRSRRFQEGVFRDLGRFLAAGDVLVLNNTEVIRARLFGKTASGSNIEVLLLREKETGIWEALVKPARRGRIDSDISFDKEAVTARVAGITETGTRLLKFQPCNIEPYLASIGNVPLPPYIKKPLVDARSYQTVYARKKGAVAAPTAGLHFTGELLNMLQHKGIEIAWVTLHCGLATFRPVKADDIRRHRIDSEYIELSDETAALINSAKKEKRRIVAVGTTAIRTLESAAIGDERGGFRVKPYQGRTQLYIVPGYRFKIIDAVITNFHTPASTNLILIASFCGLKLTQKSYAFAKERGFRFFSFGDAMFIRP